MTLSLFGGSGLAACDSSQSEAPIASAASASATMSVAQPSAPLWAQRTRFVYALEMKSSLGVSGSTSLAFEFGSELTLDARRLTGGTVELALALPTARFVAVEANSRASYDALSEELRAPFVAKFDDARLTELRLGPGASAFAISIASTIASVLQVSHRPRAAAGDTWSLEESDGTGSYEAEYRRSPEPDTLTKRKLSYRPLALRQGPGIGFTATFTPEVKRSASTIVLAAVSASSDRPSSFRIVRLDASEELLSRIGNSEIASETSVKLSFTREASAEPPVDWSALLASTKPVDRNAPARAPDASYDSLRIGSYTFDTALAEMESQAKDPKQNELYGRALGQPVAPGEVDERETRLAEQGKVFTAMAAIFRSRPQDIARAVKEVRKKSRVSRTLIDAIASAGTPAAQRALVELMDNPAYGTSDRKSAAFSISRLANASPATVTALARHVDDPLLRVHALFGLGTLCRRLREAGETERSAHIAETLIAALNAAKSPAAQVESLRAIANSGHASAFDAVQPFFSAKQNKVRVAAVDAIRLMQRPEVDAIVAASLTDSQPEVQLAAVDALSVREPSDTLVNALGPAADKIEKVSTRVRLVRVMGHFVPKRPELRVTLERLAANDPSEDVKKAARDSLGS